MTSTLRTRIRTIAKLSAALILLSVSTAQANATCKGKSRITLSDGSQACVLAKELTSITKSSSIGGTTRLKSSMNGAGVIVDYMKERDAGEIGLKVIKKRAIEICKRFKDEFLAQVSRPGNPFMVVIQTWSNKPHKSIIGDSLYLKKTYLTKNCWVKRPRKP